MWIIKKNVCFTLLLIPVLCVSQNVDTLEYINKNKFSLESCTSQGGLENYKFYFVGETHSQSENLNMKIELIKQLYLFKGVRVVVFEYPVSFESKINEYLDKGDSATLNELIYYLPNDKDLYKSFFRELYLFNLNQAEKIIIKNVDTENNNLGMAEDAILKIINKKQLPPNLIVPTINEIKTTFSRRRINKKKIIKICEKALLNLEENNTIYKQYLGNDYSFFKRLLYGIKGGSEYKVSTDIKILSQRENYLFQNFKVLLEEFPKENFFMQIGRIHICLKQNTNWLFLSEWTSLVSMINSLYPKETCSIPIYYPHDPNETSHIFRTPIIPNSVAPLFIKMANDKTTLFKLNGEGSPFMELTDRYQYIIFSP